MRLLAAVLIGFVALFATPSIAATQPRLQAASPMLQTNPGGDLRSLAETLGDRIHPEILRRSPINTSGFQLTLAELSGWRKKLSVSRDTRVGLAQKLERQQASQAKLSREVEQATIGLDAAATETEKSRAELEGFAIASFKEPTASMWLEVIATGETSSDLRLRRQVEAQLAKNHSENVSGQAYQQDKVGHITTRLTEVSVEVNVSSAMLADTDKEIAEAERSVERLASQLVTEVLLAPIGGLPFPVVVLDAYYRAQLSIAETNPQCAVVWHQLAGIGKVETGHGTFGGRTVGGDGRTTTPITGPELNGDPFLAISDTDGGVLDNNPVWDHAVGPMQFIPTSWTRYGADGNGDSVSDPHNMYDAALAAGQHLCGSRSQLVATENFTAALFGYNRSTSYGVKVKSHATAYAQALSLN